MSLQTRPTFRTPVQQIIEAATGQPAAEALRERYVERRMTQQEIADEFGVSRISIVRAMRDLGVATRYLKRNAA